jgi:hypothetical protein
MSDHPQQMEADEDGAVTSGKFHHHSNGIPEYLAFDQAKAVLQDRRHQFQAQQIFQLILSGRFEHDTCKQMKMIASIWTLNLWLLIPILISELCR